MAVASLAAIVEELLEYMWTRQEPDANRLGRMRVLASVARDRAERLGGLSRKGEGNVRGSEKRAR